MATVDKLIVRIEADMKDLKAGLAQTQRATKNATSNIRQSFTKLRGTSSTKSQRLGVYNA